MTREEVDAVMVCSAHAEVIPCRKIVYDGDGSLLRTRGGDPLLGRTRVICCWSAPHTRR